MSQLGHRQLEHLPLGRIRQRMLSQFSLGFAGPWDILTQKQVVCLWGQSCEGLRWCHIARLSHRLSPSQRRDQLPVASEQRYHEDIFQGIPCGRLCYDIFWNHTGFCLVSCVFQDTRLSGHQSCAQELCIDSWSVQWVGNWVCQYGLYLVWGLGSLLLLSTVEENQQRSIHCLGSLLGSSVCPRGDVSADCCGSHQVQVHGA